MSHLNWLLVAALVSPIQVAGQGPPSTHVPFSGCYQVVSQVWHPSNEDTKLIPDRFELRTESAFGPSSGMFAVRSVPASDNPTEWGWVWRPKGNGLWIDWGTGLGGLRGSFKRSRTDEFVGKFKEWCDSRCGWKRRVGIIRIQEINCTE